MASGTKLYCWGCKSPKEIYYTEEETLRSFCADCVTTIPPSSDEMRLMYLLLTIPFKVGDRVEARTAATVFDGVGVVEDVSTSLEHGGTVVYPSFLVRLETKEHDKAPDSAWYTEICLTKVTTEVSQ